MSTLELLDFNYIITFMKHSMPELYVYMYFFYVWLLELTLDEFDILQSAWFEPTAIEVRAK